MGQKENPPGPFQGADRWLATVAKLLLAVDRRQSDAREPFSYCRVNH